MVEEVRKTLNLESNMEKNAGRFCSEWKGGLA
jgi:hypothetical protein